MSKFVLTGVRGNIGGVAATYALEIAQPDTRLVFTTSDPSRIPKETLKSWESKGVTVSAASYDDLSSLKAVFAGAEAVTLIST